MLQRTHRDIVIALPVPEPCAYEELTLPHQCQPRPLQKQ